MLIVKVAHTSITQLNFLSISCFLPKGGEPLRQYWLKAAVASVHPLGLLSSRFESHLAQRVPIPWDFSVPDLSSVLPRGSQSPGPSHLLVWVTSCPEDPNPLGLHRSWIEWHLAQRVTIPWDFSVPDLSGILPRGSQSPGTSLFLIWVASYPEGANSLGLLSSWTKTQKDQNTVHRWLGNSSGVIIGWKV